MSNRVVITWKPFTPCVLPQQGQGIARQRQAIVNGLRDSVMVVRSSSSLRYVC